jgi:hypothetical protein
MITNPDGPGARHGEEPERSSSPSGASRDDVNSSRAEPSKPSRGEEKDQGFGRSHGYPPGHGGPTSPGDAPATGKGTPAKKKDADDALDPAQRRSAPDTEPDRR